MKIHKKILATVFTAFFLLMPVVPVYAAKSVLLPDCLQVSRDDPDYANSGPFSPKCKSVTTFVTLAINIGAFAFSIIGAIALGALVYGGFMMVISAGNAEKVKEGWGAIIAAVIGLGVTFSGYILINFLVNTVGLDNTFSFIK